MFLWFALAGSCDSRIQYVWFYTWNIKRTSQLPFPILVYDKSFPYAFPFPFLLKSLSKDLNPASQPPSSALIIFMDKLSLAKVWSWCIITGRLRTVRTHAGLQPCLWQTSCEWLCNKYLLFVGPRCMHMQEKLLLWCNFLVFVRFLEEVILDNYILQKVNNKQFLCGKRLFLFFISFFIFYFLFLGVRYIFPPLIK